MSARAPTSRYATVLASSRRARWALDDVIAGRTLDAGDPFLPDALTLLGDLPFLQVDEGLLFGRIQARSYAHFFDIAERCAVAKVLELAHEHALGDVVAAEALVGFAGEELKHRELFARMASLVDACLPPGWAPIGDAGRIARRVLGHSSWATLALTCHVELASLPHYKATLTARMSPLWADVLRAHWLEESQHVLLDELEWRRADAALLPVERDTAVAELAELFGGFDQQLRAQAAADAHFFFSHVGRAFFSPEREAIERAFVRAYRHQFLPSLDEPGRFADLLGELAGPDQLARVARSLA